MIIGGLPSSLINFRGELIKDLSKKYNVIGVASGAAMQDKELIENMGIKYIDIKSNRTSLNPFLNLFSIYRYRQVLITERPDVVISYTIKPVIFAGIALMGLNRTNFYVIITGLGYAFQTNDIWGLVIKYLVKNFYRISLKKANKVIFQNDDDKNYFIINNIVDKNKCLVVNGSGVPLNQFKYFAPTSSNITFIMVSRMIWQKGVKFYIEAAKIVKKGYPDINFKLVGGLDNSPDKIDIKIISKWSNQGIIEYLGHLKDVKFELINSHVFVLPSYYREGIPRSILEAMAIGRPIITTDNVGCKETVINGLNGWLVESKNSKKLAEKMIWFIENKESIKKMGLESRRIVEEKFDVVKINKELLNFFKL